MSDGVMSPDQVDRLRVAMPQVVETIDRLARDLDLTTAELLAVLAFLDGVARAGELILLSDVLGLSRLVDDQTHPDPAGTPSNVLGPSYREGAPWVGNPGTIARRESVGEPLVIDGSVSDSRTGAGLAGAVIDVWQADGKGDYSSPTVEHPWNLRGRQRADGRGTFELRTVRPRHYTIKHDGPTGRLLEALGRHPWRPAHIHFADRLTGTRRAEPPSCIDLNGQHLGELPQEIAEPSASCLHRDGVPRDVAVVVAGEGVVVGSRARAADQVGSITTRSWATDYVP